MIRNYVTLQFSLNPGEMQVGKYTHLLHIAMAKKPCIAALSLVWQLPMKDSSFLKARMVATPETIHDGGDGGSGG